jgi:hypothetical protein
MILSGPKLCLGSTKDARILPAFLHSPGSVSTTVEEDRMTETALTPHGRRQRVVDTERHLVL